MSQRWQLFDERPTAVSRARGFETPFLRVSWLASANGQQLVQIVWRSRVTT